MKIASNLILTLTALGVATIANGLKADCLVIGRYDSAINPADASINGILGYLPAKSTIKDGETTIKTTLEVNNTIGVHQIGIIANDKLLAVIADNFNEFNHEALILAERDMVYEITIVINNTTKQTSMTVKEIEGVLYSNVRPVSLVSSPETGNGTTAPTTGGEAIAPASKIGMVLTTNYKDGKLVLDWVDMNELPPMGVDVTPSMPITDTYRWLDSYNSDFSNNTFTYINNGKLSQEIYITSDGVDARGLYAKSTFGVGEEISFLIPDTSLFEYLTISSDTQTNIYGDVSSSELFGSFTIEARYGNAGMYIHNGRSDALDSWPVAEHLSVIVNIKRISASEVKITTTDNATKVVLSERFTNISRYALKDAGEGRLVLLAVPKPTTNGFTINTVNP